MTKEDGVKKERNRYYPSQIEEKWQQLWKEIGLYKFSQDSKKEKYYPLVELPYPSGDLHIGHWFSFVTADVHARVHKMMGKNVFFTNGYDAFGLPAENAAIKRGIHPKDWTIKNIETMTKQFETMGSMIDWSHTTAACYPEYYKWNQWIFIRMYEKGLAYRGKMLTNWCPKDQTVLANENIENGRCWRCGSEVVQKEIEQWFIKLTEYANDLIWPEHPKVDWPISVRVAQNQWIGKKEGVNIEYEIANTKYKINVFTTRPDTNFGATFIAIAPEHHLIRKITTPDNKKEVEKYLEAASKKTEMNRLAEAREKTGVFTGAYAINQLNGAKMPIWVSDFVLIGFGTGALVGVPGHDKRDFEFANKFKLEIKRVVIGKNGDDSPITSLKQVQEEEGRMVNSDFLNGLDINEATKKIIEFMVEKRFAKRTVSYHIHDWSISRQRYWGTPVPMIHCKKDGIVPVPDNQLPVELPYNVDFTPKGKPPLATAKDWMKTTCPKCGGEAQRDPETLDTFFDSSWYFFRYLDPHYDKGPFNKSDAEKLTPVDIYFGGAEHTLGHTLYARFFTRFFRDLGLIDFDEFAKKRVQHGVILGTDGARMSKSKGNVVNPDEVVREYGADAARIYLCFMMPYEATAPWAPGGMWGTYRFLKRVWDLQFNLNDKELSKTDLFEMHTAIKKVQEDARSTKFNTGVSTLMKWINYLSGKDSITLEEYKTFILILAPFAPHISEELYQGIQNKKSFSISSSEQAVNSKEIRMVKFESVHSQVWPVFNEKYLQQEDITVVVQINGKMRDSLRLDSKTSQNEIIKLAKQKENVKKYLEGKIVKKIIYISGKVVNFVVN